MVKTRVFFFRRYEMIDSWIFDCLCQFLCIFDSLRSISDESFQHPKRLKDKDGLRRQGCWMCVCSRRHLGLPTFVSLRRTKSRRRRASFLSQLQQKPWSFLVVPDSLSPIFHILFKSMQTFVFLSHIFSQTVCRIHGSSRKEKKDKDDKEQDTNNAMSNVSIGTPIFLHKNREMVSSNGTSFCGFSIILKASTSKYRLLLFTWVCYGVVSIGVQLEGISTTIYRGQNKKHFPYRIIRKQFQVSNQKPPPSQPGFNGQYAPVNQLSNGKWTP